MIRPCKDCLYFINGRSNICTFNERSHVLYDEIAGQNVTHFWGRETCEKMRSEHGPCGPDAELYCKTTGCFRIVLFAAVVIVSLVASYIMIR